MLLFDQIAEALAVTRRAVDTAPNTPSAPDADPRQELTLLADVVEHNILNLFASAAMAYLLRECTVGRHTSTTALTLTIDLDHAALGMTTTDHNASTKATDLYHPGYPS